MTSIILLITAQLAAAYDGEATITIDQKKLKTTALILGVLFLATTAIRVYQIVIST